MRKARDFMSTGLTIATPELTIGEAVDELLSKRISGLPVTANDGTLIGIISEFALLTIAYDPESRHEMVADHMSTEVITVEEDADLTEIANAIIVHRVRRLPVVRDGKLVGIITRRDLLREANHLACQICATSPAAPEPLG